MNFDEFKDECLPPILLLQDDFVKLYDLKSYERWFYDHSIGAFHFKSNDGRNLYFEYIDVGSYSTTQKNWMWSWNNKSTPKHVAKGLEKVRAFGEENQFSDLTNGLINGDEYTGWTLTSITAKLLNGIGIYRIRQEHLYIYFVFTKELSQDDYDDLKQKHINCDVHGVNRVAFVCQHLLRGVNLGFFEAFESNPLIEPDDDYWGWCQQCEKIWLKEGEWNDTVKAFAQMKVVCDQCYFEIKERNIASNQTI